MRFFSPRLTLTAASLFCLGIEPALNAAGHDGGVEHHADTTNSVPVPLPGTLDVSDPNDLLIRQARGATLHIPFANIRAFSFCPDAEPVEPAKASKGKFRNLLTISYQDRLDTIHNLVLEIAGARAQAAVKDLEEQTGLKAGVEPLSLSLPAHPRGDVQASSR